MDHAPYSAPRRNNRAAGLVLTAVGAGAAIFLIVRLADLILMVFSSVLLAMLLLALAAPLQRKLGIGRTAAVALVLVILLALGGGLSWLLGAQLSAQISSLAVLLPRSWRSFEGYLGATSLGHLALDQIRSAKLPDNFMIGWATRLVGNVAAVVVASVVVLAGAMYLAFHPETYRGGVLKLIPQAHRRRADQVLEACRRALTQWLVGQTVSMCFIALTTSAGLWLAGVPAPLALGILAGLGHAVPVIGPWMTAAPGVLVAAAQGPQTLGVAFAIYMITSQIESNLLMPLVLRRISEVPMAVTLFAVVAMGTLLGVFGVLLATPLAVLAYVLVRKVYLEDVLGDRSEDEVVRISSRPSVT
jgi:predicted PurR-regulated permease PerM